MAEAVRTSSTWSCYKHRESLCRCQSLHSKIVSPNSLPHRHMKILDPFRRKSVDHPIPYLDIVNTTNQGDDHFLLDWQVAVCDNKSTPISSSHPIPKDFSRGPTSYIFTFQVPNPQSQKHQKSWSHRIPRVHQSRGRMRGFVPPEISAQPVVLASQR